MMTSQQDGRVLYLVVGLYKMMLLKSGQETPN